MRLIDADAFIEYANNRLDLFASDLTEMINEQPTAYDVDAVVEEIKEATFGVNVTYVDSEDVVESEEAIRIIRKGGVNE